MDEQDVTEVSARGAEEQDVSTSQQSETRPNAGRLRPPRPTLISQLPTRLPNHNPNPRSVHSASANAPAQEKGDGYFMSPRRPSDPEQNESGRPVRPPPSRDGRSYPYYSVSGPETPGTPSGTYVHPQYRKLNPQYGKQGDNPIWGLAKPLPRVIRPGMRKDREDDGKITYDFPEAGETEPVPQLENIPSRANQTSSAQTPSSRQPQIIYEGTPLDTSVQGSPMGGIASMPPRSGFTGHGPATSFSGNLIQSPHRALEKPQEATVQDTEQQPASKDDNEFFNTWAKIRHTFRAPMAEWLGTTVGVIIGLCGSLAVTSSNQKAGDHQSTNWAWGLGYMVGIYISGGISGAHLNPAISIALSAFRGFPARQCTYYIVSQILGAVTAGGIAYCLYHNSIIKLGDVPWNPEGISFYTEPIAGISNVTGFFNEFVATALLMCSIFALGDDSNAPPGAGMHSFIIGLLIFVLSLCLGYNTGGCFNPVRDFGPRLVALMTGEGGHVFTDRYGWWFWGPWLATISGAIFGAAVYDLFVFAGGESPINYPRKRRKRAQLKKSAKWRRRLRLGRSRIPEIEEGLKEVEKE